jgi:sodium-dependent dicarboxylate transporter 2/3/5
VPAPPSVSLPAPVLAARRGWPIVAAAVLGGVLLALPVPSGLPAAGHRTGVLFAVALLLWATEALPIAITAVLTLVAQPMLGVAPLGTAFTSFISPVFFFVLVMFVIAQAVTTTGLARRFASWLLAVADGSTERTLLMIMIGTAAMSTVVSDVPCAAIFMAVALGLFEKMGLEPGRSRFATSVMIGIPIASLIGGVGTPAGSSVNVLGLGFIEKLGGVRVTFVQWMALGLPMVVVLVPLAARVIVWWHPPEQARIEHADFRAEFRALGPLTTNEWKLIGIFGVMLASWVISSWVPAIDVVIVAVLGAAAMFLPGIGLFATWQEVERGIAWDALLMIGAVTSLGVLSASSGLAKWLVDLSLGGMETWPVALILGAVSAFIVIVHLPVPINPAIVAAMVPPIVLLAASTNHNPALYGLPVVFTASCAFLLPLDAVPLVTYGKGYYRMFDMLVPGLIISVAWVVAMTVVMLLIGPVVGVVH